MSHIKIRQRRTEDGGALSSVSVSGIGKVTTRLRRHPKETGDLSKVDIERLATIVSLDKMLRLRERPGIKAVLPMPVEAALGLIHRLIKLKRASILSQDPGVSQNFNEVLEKAKNSPIRSVRALAAAAMEFLK